MSEPPARDISAGVERGRVLIAAGVAAAGGTTVEVIDASDPTALRVVASGTTNASGAFSISADLSAVAPAARWLRAAVGGTHLRAFAAGWTEVTPGTEGAVTEIARLRRAGRLAEPPLASLVSSQDLLSLLWLAGHGGLAPAPAAASLLAEVRTHAAWNRWLERLSAGTSEGPGDIAGLVPVTETSSTVSVVKDGGTPGTAVLRNFCSSGLASDVNNCSLSTTNDVDLFESLGVDRSGVRLREVVDGSDALSRLIGQAGDLPLIEFAPVVGTRVLYDNPRVTLQGLRASMRIVRRTYPAESVGALGASPQAVRVVLDYEIAILDTATGQQVDLLAREQRWFVPKAGRVRLDAQGLVRQSARLETASLAVTAGDLSGAFFLSPRVPFAGLADAQAVGLRHHHAVHSHALDRIYAASPSSGGIIVELDARTMATLRTLSVGTVPRRLAMSADGQYLFAGLDDGSIAEWRLSDLALLSRTAPVPNPASSGVFSLVRDLAVDPFDARRVLALLGVDDTVTRAAVALFRDGVLLTRDAPDPSLGIPWGWPAYAPSALAWSTLPNEVLMRGYQETHRLAIGAGGFSALYSQPLVEDMGWQDVGGEIVTDRGSVRSAATFAPLRTLSLEPLTLDTCMRFDAHHSLCRFRAEGVLPPNLLLLDHASGAFVGVYQPTVTSVANGCPETQWRENSFGLDDVTLTPIGAGRLLASHLSTPDGRQRCSLQVWTLRGV